MATCICNDVKQTHSVTCAVCGSTDRVLMEYHERMQNCPIHRFPINAYCGPTCPVCQKCQLAGWVSTAGYGGGMYIDNQITKEYIDVLDGKRGIRE